MVLARSVVFMVLKLSFLASLLCSSSAFIVKQHLTPQACSWLGVRPTSSLFLFDFLKQQQQQEDGPEKSNKLESPPAQSNDAEESDDPVDKIFGFFFGKKEEAPLGLKRFGQGMCLALCEVSLVIYHLLCMEKFIATLAIARTKFQQKLVDLVV